MAILENKSNYIIIKENDLIKLFSYTSLVCVYNTITKTFENITYSFENAKNEVKTFSKTTNKHITQFKNYIINKGL